MQESRTFSLRLDYEDGTFEVVEVSGVESPKAAIDFAVAADSEIVQATWIGSVDSSPTTPLVSFGSGPTPDEIADAVRRLQSELDASAPAIARILEEDETERRSL